VSIEKVLKIRDPYTISIGLEDTTLVCPDSTFSLSANASGGYEPLSYSWSNGDTTEVTSFPATTPGSYIVTVNDVLNCPNSPFSDTAEISMDYVILSSVSGQEGICPGETITIEALVSNGAEPIVYQWESGQNTDSITVTLNESTTFYYSATDACNITVTDSVFVSTFGDVPVEVFISNILPNFTLVEGCLTGQLIFVRSDDTEVLSVPLTYSGTATFGTDFTGIPETLNFQVGQDSLTFELNPTNDGSAEGTDGFENLVFSYTLINDCGNDTTVVSTIRIRDAYTLNPNLNDATFACPVESLTLDASVSGGYEPYSYQWSNGDTTAAITVAITGTTTISVQVSDSLNCPNSPFNDQAIITMEYDSLVSSPFDTLICEGDSISIEVQVQAGAELIDIIWNTSPSQTAQSIIVFPTDTTFYAYSVTDECNVQVYDTVIVFVPNYPDLNLSASDTTICSKNSEATLFGISVGGDGNYTYQFDGPGAINLNTDSTALVNPSSPSTYFVTVTDGCGNTASDSLRVLLKNCELIVPNAYSPNGDGKNELFTITNIEFYPGSTVYLYTRWGKKVFEQTDYKNDWSGSDVLTSGTYFYVVEPNDGSEPLKGYVTIFLE
jgi:gliding motility-associated-like protein